MDIEIYSRIPISIWDKSLSFEAKLFAIDCINLHRKGYRSLNTNGTELYFAFNNQQSFKVSTLIFFALDFNEITIEQALILVYFAYIAAKSKNKHGYVKLNKDLATKTLGISKTKLLSIIDSLILLKNLDDAPYLEKKDKVNTFYSHLIDPKKHLELAVLLQR